MTNHRKLAGLIAVIIAVFCWKSPARAQSEQEKVEAAKEERRRGLLVWFDERG